MRRGHHEVDPPHAEGQADAGYRHQDGIDGPALCRDHRRQRGDGADHALPEGDDHEQSVALGDVMGVPRCPAPMAFDEQRAGQFDRRHHRDQQEGHRDRRLRDQDADPADLRDGDRGGVGQARLSAVRILHGRTNPLRHHGNSHHDVPGDHQPVVDVRAGVDRGVDRRDAQRQDDHPDHLHHRHQPVHPVVGVIGRREPAEIDPGPTDRERGEHETGQARAEVVFGEQVREFGCGDTEGDDERQIEQQFQWSRDAMVFVRISAGHPAHPMRGCRGLGNGICCNHPDILSHRPAQSFVSSVVIGSLLNNQSRARWRS